MSFKIRLMMIAFVVALSSGATSSHAATVDLTFDTIAKYTGSPAVVGSAPWLTLDIQDVAPGAVQLTVSTLLPPTGSPPQSLTGIWLNVPGAVTAGLSSLTLTPGSGTGQNPFSFT